MHLKTKGKHIYYYHCISSVTWHYKIVFKVPWWQLSCLMNKMSTCIPPPRVSCQMNLKILDLNSDRVMSRLCHVLRLSSSTHKGFSGDLKQTLCRCPCGSYISQSYQYDSIGNAQSYCCEILTIQLFRLRAIWYDHILGGSIHLAYSILIFHVFGKGAR